MTIKKSNKKTKKLYLTYSSEGYWICDDDKNIVIESCDYGAVVFELDKNDLKSLGKKTIVLK